MLFKLRRLGKLGFEVNELSGIDYMRERIQESRQNETISYLMFIAGAVFFIGGLIETVTSPGNANWFFFIPYKSIIGITSSKSQKRKF